MARVKLGLLTLIQWWFGYQELCNSKEVYDYCGLRKHHKTSPFFLSFTWNFIAHFQPSQIFISSPFHSISSFGALRKVIENHFLKVTLSSHLLGW
ncbi:hypothetical protein QL285_022060 [Trifolium repens]|nr:hypothetical protein QL285_022060 [Trifolium repens]